MEICLLPIVQSSNYSTKNNFVFKFNFVSQLSFTSIIRIYIDWESNSKFILNFLNCFKEKQKLSSLIFFSIIILNVIIILTYLTIYSFDIWLMNSQMIPLSIILPKSDLKVNFECNLDFWPECTAQSLKVRSALLTVVPKVNWILVAAMEWAERVTLRSPQAGHVMAVKPMYKMSHCAIWTLKYLKSSF